MYEYAKNGFENYIKNYNLNDKLIKLKYDHTYQVVDLMMEIACRLNLSKEEIELAKIIGLLHDIGRFEQIKEYEVISDKKTNTDHAQIACTYLFDNGHIRDFIKIDKYDEIIKNAIYYHNKFKLPSNMKGKTLMFSKMIRDMDKIDIYRVLSINYEWEFNASNITKEVLEEFSKEESIDDNTVKTVSDKVIFYLAFIFDINYNESFDILVNVDNFDLFLSIVNVDVNSEKLWKKLKEVCFDKINRGVVNE